MKKIDCRDKDQMMDLKAEDEFEGLVLRAKEGDEKAVADIVERLRPLIINSIRRYFNDYSQYDDLVQDGNLMIMESIADFDKSKGIHFLGYIKLKLKFMYLDKHKIRVHSSLNVPVAEDIQAMDLLICEDSDILASMVENEEEAYLKEALKCLSSRQKQVIRLHYLEEMNMIAIAEFLDMSYRTVVNTKAAAIDRLKKEFSRKKLNDNYH